LVSLSLIILLIVWFLIQDWGTIMYAPGVQSSQRWGFPVSRSLEILIFIFCLVSLIAFLVRKISTADEKVQIDQKICTSCMEVFESFEIESEICPKCAGNVENVNGVFDRNTDILKKTKNKSS